jgi:hypothetical protein
MTPDIIRKMRRWMGRGQKPPRAGFQTRRIEFQLTYGSLCIGVLAYEDHIWEWAYSGEFKAQDKVRPLVEFPDTSRIYRTEELWPFFATRVPSLKQTAVRALIEKERIDPDDEVKLLERFGRRTVANPFELKTA